MVRTDCPNQENTIPPSAAETIRTIKSKISLQNGQRQNKFKSRVAYRNYLASEAYNTMDSQLDTIRGPHQKNLNRQKSTSKTKTKTDLATRLDWMSVEGLEARNQG
ncbi:hypothetical protein Droror1_Dr00024874 [Drosera rotundifolia]